MYVIDSNVVLSCLVSGKSEIILSPKLALFAPQKLLEETIKHKGEIVEKSRLSEDEVSILLNTLLQKIVFAPDEEFDQFLPAAKSALGEHEKDAPYVALALMLKCPFWTYEKLLLKLTIVEMVTTDDVSKSL